YTIAPYATATPVSLYTVGLDPTSSGNLGCVMLTTSVGTTMSFRFSLGGVSGGIASKGRIVEFDNPSGAGTVASGIMSRQTGTFATSSLSPAYAFGVDGEDLTGKPIAAAGSFSVSSANGNISSASADVDIAGTNSSALSGGTGTITGISATNGRGTASFSMSGTTFAWTIYIVNANQVYLISTASPAGGRALATSTSFSAPSGNYVAYSTGISSCSGTPCSDVNLARLTLNSGAASGTVWDYSISAGESSAAVSGGTYTTPGLSGRVAFTNTGSNGLISYLVSPAVDGISSITVGTDAGAHFGYMAAQPTTAAPSGQFIYGTLDPRYNTVTTYAGTATITPGGAFTGTEDESSQSGGLLSAVAASRTVTLGPNGTGSASVANGSSIAVTDGTRIFWFDFGNGAPPVITIAEPQ
ncbi:MAG: hypothetical protein LAO06_21335, partial [Acidobacteriia bacterium]|nr:hypothetical protein [Terriglobia bacterium]